MDSLEDKNQRVFEMRVSKSNQNWSKEWKVLLPWKKQKKNLGLNTQPKTIK